jgi:indole-3-glycerol phosphate synthase
MVVASILQRIVAQKRRDIQQAKDAVSQSQLDGMLADALPVRDFHAALIRDPGVSLIAEVKRASPSKGVLRRNFDPLEIAEAYAANGATCISVLTDEHFFSGHLNDLKSVRRHVEIPVLRKDFIITPYQVVEARVAGADAVLLIAECLDAATLKQLHDQILNLGMTALVELYEEKNLQMVLDCGANLIGINNRDLNTFETHLAHSIDLKNKLPAGKTVVSESGIYTPDDVQMLAAAGVDAMLVGESLMRADDIGVAVRRLLGR